ncbi:MAG: tyrosine-protein phosphatase [Pseudomonadota bacterium]
MTVRPRFLPLEGSINFRDFGGYETTDGRRVAWERLYRCGALSMLTPEAEADFAGLGITVICDLRRDDEAEMNPTPARAPFECRLHIPIAPGSSPMLRESLQRGGAPEEHIRFMVDITREIARNHHAAYRTLFEELLATPGAFLLHCSAGKDRTGFGAALILTALGVDEETVMRDYLLTNEAQCLRRFMNERMRGNYGPSLDDESIEAITGVRAEYLQAALDEVARSHGSLQGYLEEIGIDRHATAELRSRLLD